MLIVARALCLVIIAVFMYKYGKCSDIQYMGNIVTALIGYITFEVTGHSTYDNVRSESKNSPLLLSDRELIEKALRMISSDSDGIKYLKNGPYSSYSAETVKPLEEYARIWDNPDHVFYDTVLRVKSDEYLNALKKFIGTLYKCSSPGNMQGEYTLKRGDDNFEEQEMEQKNIVNAIENAYRAYAEYVHELKKRR